MTVEIGLLIAVVGCFVGLAGWLSKRDSKISNDAEWKGKVDAKLDSIQGGVSGINERMSKMEGKVEEHETRITVLEKGAGKERII